MTNEVIPKERPILFSGPMVRAVLVGRKVQTRRPLKSQPIAGITEVHNWGILDPDTEDWERWGFWGCEGLDRSQPHNCLDHEARCPFGWRGSRLWVRETWCPEYPERRDFIGDVEAGQRVEYRADWSGIDEDVRWFPSIHMPRWASRITLEVTDVRVERVQEISAEDAVAEGLSKLTKDGGRTWKYGIPDRDGLPGQDDDGWPWQSWHVDPREAFRALWESTYTRRGIDWDSNPWVWVATFKQLEAGGE